MSLLRRSTSPFSAFVCALVLAGCSTAATPTSSGAGTQPVAAGRTTIRLPDGMRVAFGPYSGPASHRGGGWMSPAAKSGLTGIIYGASYDGGFVNLYALHGTDQTVIGQLTNSLVSPQGIVVDGAHRVWIANTNAGNIVAFKRGETTPFRTLDDANEFPVAVAIDESGNVYAANAESTTGPPGNVVMYAPGATSPTETLTFSDFNIVLGLGIDAQGNRYVSYIGSQGPSVVEFPKGSTTGQQLNMADLEISDIIFDDSADLLMEDGSGGLGVWPSPYQGLPSKTIPAFGNEPTLNAVEARVWVALADPNSPEILAYNMKTGDLVDTITAGFNGNALPYGVALDPRASLAH